MAETYISIEKIRSLAEVGAIDELKDSTDMNEIFAACAIASNTSVLSLMTNSLPPPQSLQRAGLPR